MRAAGPAARLPGGDTCNPACLRNASNCSARHRSCNAVIEPEATGQGGALLCCVGGNVNVHGAQQLQAGSAVPKQWKLLIQLPINVICDQLCESAPCCSILASCPHVSAKKTAPRVVFGVHTYCLPPRRIRSRTATKRWSEYRALLLCRSAARQSVGQHTTA